MRALMTGITQSNVIRCDLHTHDCWELVLCIQGESRLQVGERIIPFTPGVIVCQPPHLLHGLIETKGYQDLWIQVEDFAPPIPDEVPVFADDGGKRFFLLAQMMHEAFFTRDVNQEKLIGALWNALYQLLCSKATENTYSPVVQQLMQDMIRNFALRDYSLSDTIRATGYCVDYMRRLFHAETGCTPMEYLTRLRIENARRLLALPNGGGHSVRQVALLCGYDDPYYFSRLFRRHTGCSPREYQKLHDHEF